MGGVPGLGADAKEASFIRLGGMAGLVALALHILINYVLIESPLEGGEHRRVQRRTRDTLFWRYTTRCILLRSVR